MRTSASWQGFMRDVRGAGRATLTAAIDGPMYEPNFTGSAVITDGRLRHFSLPNSLEGINGAIRFDSRGHPGWMTSQQAWAAGACSFGGRVALDGYLPGDLNVTVRGEDMHLRYPEGIRVDRGCGPVAQRQRPGAHAGRRRPRQTGGRGHGASIRTAAFSILEAPANGSRRGADSCASACSGAVRSRTDWCRRPCASRTTWPAWLPAPISSCAAPTIGPCSSGARRSTGEKVTFEGRRYLVTRGNIDFTNPTGIEPFFDVEAADPGARSGPDLSR
jgi:hypothetical protein